MDQQAIVIGEASADQVVAGSDAARYPKVALEPSLFYLGADRDINSNAVRHRSSTRSATASRWRSGLLSHTGQPLRQPVSWSPTVETSLRWLVRPD